DQRREEGHLHCTQRRDVVGDAEAPERMSIEKGKNDPHRDREQSACFRRGPFAEREPGTGEGRQGNRYYQTSSAEDGDRGTKGLPDLSVGCAVAMGSPVAHNRVAL